MSRIIGLAMVPLSLSSLLLAGSGCVGDAPKQAIGQAVDAGSGVDASAQDLARRQFDTDVAPLLTSLCGSCHGASASASPFMDNGTGTMYQSVLEWPRLVSFRLPSASSLLVRGAHAGPAWKSAQAQLVRSWIDAEAVINPEDTTYIETQSFIPVAGDNTINLSDIDSSLMGATITFRLDVLGSGFYLTLLSVNAAAKGIHLVHPTFVTWDADTPTSDSVDRFSNVDLFVSPLESASLGGGTAVLIGPDLSTPISLRFTKAEAADEGGTVLVGCNDVASFTSNARALLETNCLECHDGTRGDATAATDMTKIMDLSAEGQAAACGQILSRVSLGDANNSSLFLACEPGSSLGHEFKFNNSTANFLAFRTSLLTWVTAEQDSQ